MRENSINRNLERLSEVSWLLENRNLPEAEKMITEVIAEIESSDFFKEDETEGRLLFESVAEKKLYRENASPDTDGKDVCFPYSHMYELKAESLGDNAECIQLLEKAHKWAPVNNRVTNKLLEAYFEFGLYDKALELALQTFRFVNDEYCERQLLYEIRRIGEGCWELMDIELENAEKAIALMDVEAYAKDFAKFGIPTSTDEIRNLSDEQIETIVKKCYPDQCKVIIETSSEVFTQEEACPCCGDNRFFVTRSGCSMQEEIGLELYIEDGGPLTASCARCRGSITVPWVERRNRTEEKNREKENLRKFEAFLRERKEVKYT